jgi:hypothetical protein
MGKGSSALGSWQLGSGQIPSFAYPVHKAHLTPVDLSCASVRPVAAGIGC